MLDPYPTFTPLASFSNVASIFRMAAPDADQEQPSTGDCFLVIPCKLAQGRCFGPFIQASGPNVPHHEAFRERIIVIQHDHVDAAYPVGPRKREKHYRLSTHQCIFNQATGVRIAQDALVAKVLM